MQLWMLIAALLVTGIASIATVTDEQLVSLCMQPLLHATSECPLPQYSISMGNSDKIADSQKKIPTLCIYGTIAVKRQVSLSFNLEAELGPNNEVLLLCDGEEIVYLRGFNARMFDVMDGEAVEVNLPEVVIGGGRIILDDVFEYEIKRCSPFGEEVVGPGKLFVSDRRIGHDQAFFINDACVNELALLNQFVADAPPPSVSFDIMTVRDNGISLSQVNINDGEFDIVVTGATAKRIGATESVAYSGGTLTAQGQSFDNIENFFAIDEVGGNIRASSYDSTSPLQILQGPGQLFVGATSALFIEEGSSDLVDSVNSNIVSNAFNFNQAADAALVMVTDMEANSVTILSSGTKTIQLPGAVSVTYSASDMLATFVDRGGRVTNVNVLQQLSVYDNNQVQRFTTDSSTDLSSGGTLFIDTMENTALFTANVNPEAAAQIIENTPPSEGSASYTTITDSDSVRFLVSTSGSPPVTETVQQITGSYVTNVDSSETVVFADNEVVIEKFDGSPAKRIGQVNTFVANSGMDTSGSFNISTPVPYRGPGTLSYSRGTAFFTTDEEEGQGISFDSFTAPIPDIDFEVVLMMPNEIEGYNYTVATVIQTVGDDKVITYEATSYTTTSSQEILYSGDLVTVSMPRRAGSGMVVFMGGAQTVSYTDMNGNMQVLTGVNTFHEFSGSDVTTTISPNDRTVQGRGKVYVSEDGTEVLFSNSNIITPEVAEIIRRGDIQFSIPADQFSSIYTGMYNFSTDSALVTLPGGGVIWSSTFNGSRDSFYVDNDRVQSMIRQAVGSALLLTKSPPSKDVGIIRTIFNGRVIYTYSPLGGSRDIRIGSSESFFFNGTALIGDSLPGGPYGGINMVVTFNGIEVKTINTSKQFDGFGLLLVPSDSSTAFYTTSPSTVNYLLQSIENVENFLVSPQVEPGKDSVTTKDREVAVYMGTDVTAYAGADVTFACNVKSARPEPEITFFRILPDGSAIPLNDSEGVIIDNNKLTLDNIEFADAGEYACRADNGVPPAGRASSTLTVRAAEPPVLQPGWFPFDLQSGQKLIFPTESTMTETVDLREFRELIFACRVDGRPKAEVMWRFNEMPINNTNLPRNGYEIFEVSQGRSVLVFDLLNVFNETNGNLLLGRNNIQCTADNGAGSSVTGGVNVEGEIISCNSPQLTPDTECSTTCGYGLRTYSYNCFRFTDNGVSEDIDIDDVPVRVVPLLTRHRVCTTREGVELVICPITEFRWNASEWTGCSRTCGGGFQTRSVTCLSETYSVNSRYIVVVDSVVVNVTEDLMCDMFEGAGERPADRQLCELQDCPYWQESQFGECSATCGGGVRMREVNCVTTNGTFIDMNNKTQTSIIVLDDLLCNEDEKPSNMTDCNNYPCVFRWSTGQFGPCGETSLTGPVVDEFLYCRERGVVCLNEDNDVVDDTSCDSQIRPSSLASCGGGRCFAGFWNALKYGDCSATCGYGMRTRELQCYSPDTWTLVPGDFCDISKKPYTEQQCFLQNCRGMCLRDESSLCPILASTMMCGMPFAMGNNGYRCCVSCMGMGGGD